MRSMAPSHWKIGEKREERRGEKEKKWMEGRDTLLVPSMAPSHCKIGWRRRERREGERRRRSGQKGGTPCW